MTALLELKNVTAAYGSSQVIHGVDLRLPKAVSTALLGGNGAGKTTLLRAICNMRVSRSGEIFVSRGSASTACPRRKSPGSVSHTCPTGAAHLRISQPKKIFVLGAYTRRDRTAVSGEMSRVLDYFPRLRERLAQQAGRFPAANSRCWPLRVR